MKQITHHGFTFIELLISLAVIAIAFVPLMQMFSTALEESYYVSEMNSSRYLVQEGMEKLKNLNFTKEQLKDLGDVWEPPLDKPALEFNERKWRILRRVNPAPLARGGVNKNSGPLEVRILVFQEPISPATKPTLELVTLIEDLEWMGEE